MAAKIAVHRGKIWPLPKKTLRTVRYCKLQCARTTSSQSSAAMSKRTMEVYRTGGRFESSGFDFCNEDVTQRHLFLTRCHGLNTIILGNEKLSKRLIRLKDWWHNRKSPARREVHETQADKLLLAIPADWDFGQVSNKHYRMRGSHFKSLRSSFPSWQLETDSLRSPHCHRMKLGEKLP